ncbi:hypothetical protein CBM20_11245 [Listeria monocytogenes]|nr:hypothetical protein [Listeria monocytogenes]
MTKGFEELEANLAKLSTQMPKQARKAVNEVANLFAERLKQNTPISANNSEHLRDDIVISIGKGGSQGVIEKDIGYGESQGWRIHFPDKGTVTQNAQNFTERTRTEMKPEALKVYKEEVKKVFQT